MARLFQGIGGGLILAGAMAFTSVLFGPQLRRYAIAVTNVTWIIAAIVGPVQAGVFANFGWWRGAFFLYVPIGAAFLVGVLWRFRKPPTRRRRARVRCDFRSGVSDCSGLGSCVWRSSGLAEPAALRTALIITAGLIVWYAFTRDAQAEDRLFPSQPLVAVATGRACLLGAHSCHHCVYLGRDLSAAGADRLARDRSALRWTCERPHVDRLVDRRRTVCGGARQPRAQRGPSPDRSVS